MQCAPPASKNTDAPYARVVAVVSNSAWTRTVPVKFSAGATRDVSVAARVMTSAPAPPPAACARVAAETRESATSVIAVCFIGVGACASVRHGADGPNDDYCRSLVNESEPNFQAPLCCTYTSVTTKGFVTSLPPTTASSRILFNTMAVEPMTRTEASKISACL